MNRLSWILLLCLLASCASCDTGVKSKPDTLVTSGYSESEMNAAIARAHGEIDFFLDALSNKSGTDFGVKAPVTDKGQTEHFWLTDVVYRDGQFEGKIGNDPGMVTNVKLGQPWKIRKEDISDWMFMRDDKMHGNYTMRPLLKTLPAEEAEMYRAMFAKP